MPTADKALAMPILPHELELPNVRLAPREVLTQVATSLEPGATPPQLAPSVRSVPVADFVTVAACAEDATKMNTTSMRAYRLMRLPEVLSNCVIFIDILL
jgi:hypothetical protein